MRGEKFEQGDLTNTNGASNQHKWKEFKQQKGWFNKQQNMGDMTLDRHIHLQGLI